MTLEKKLRLIEGGGGVGLGIEWHRKVCGEAANEIERLRKACQIALIHAPTIRLAPERRYTIDVLEKALTPPLSPQSGEPI